MPARSLSHMLAGSLSHMPACQPARSLSLSHMGSLSRHATMAAGAFPEPTCRRVP